MNTGNNEKVLIIDDIPENLQVLGNILSEKNIYPIFAINGEQGLASAIRNKPDLILLDISMPLMDGFEVCQKLKENLETKDIPVIFLTARTEINDIIKGFSIGAVDYITKPFNVSELIQRVFTHLELKKAKDYINIQNINLHLKNAELDNLIQDLRDKSSEIDLINSELRQINENKDKLFSIIAHDLRGPISGIKTMLEIIRATDTDNDTYIPADIMKILIETSSGTWYLLENLLAWSSSERGFMAAKIEKVHLNEIFNDTINILNSKIQEKEIQFEVNINTTKFGLADINWLNTIIRNLVSNAVKFTPAKGSIKIICDNLNDFIRIRVIDTGIGMDEKISSEIFKDRNFYSSHGTNNEKGSGLGLKICKEFVSKMGGEISVVSKFNHGSEFIFTIPAAK